MASQKGLLVLRSWWVGTSQHHYPSVPLGPSWHQTTDFSPSHPPQLVVPEYSIHGLFCLMFLCAAEWVTLGLNIPLLFYHLWR